MTPERVATIVRAWVRLYTRGLPATVAERRVEEIEADLHDQIAHERTAGRSERRIARALASRAARGIAADLRWRSRPLAGPAARVAIGVGAVLCVPLVAMRFSDQVVWSLADFVAAGVLLAAIGASFELALRRGGSRKLALALVALGGAAMAAGELDDAPGLVLLGLLLVVGGCAVSRRRARRRA
jgi:hypothetical protein